MFDKIPCINYQDIFKFFIEIIYLINRSKIVIKAGKA